eukprot:GSChrysophyteH1.ASY1.ANO1.3171.1 assembled CDS
MQGLEKSRASTASPDDGSDSIQVLVRVRPLTDLVIVDIQSSTTLAVESADPNGNKSRMFHCTYDQVLGPSASQLDVYNSVSKCTKSVIDGFNATVFAYGQTGSGKTFSMYGPPNEFGNRSATQADSSLIGVIPRAVNDIFNLSERADVIQASIYVSFIYVQGLSEYNVKSTHMNQFSSRSHSIFQIYLEQKRLSKDDGGEVYLRAKFNLVDLAGSEKWNLSKIMRDEHVTEMTKINLSLHTLGRCISSLAQRSLGKDVHAPFRDSKLTRLLQDSLGGNARTYLLATVSPLKMNIEETISTLKFADNAKRVMRLQNEVERLRGLLRMAGIDAIGNNVGAPADTTNTELVSTQQ